MSQSASSIISRLFSDPRNKTKQKFITNFVIRRVKCDSGLKKILNNNDGDNSNNNNNVNNNGGNATNNKNEDNANNDGDDGYLFHYSWVLTDN